MKTQNRYGYKPSKETKLLIRANQKNNVAVINIDTNITYISIAAAARATGTEPTSISAALRSKSHKAGSYHWRPVDTEYKPQALKKQVTRVEDGKTYESMTEAARDNNITLTMLSYCLSGKKKTAAGYHWQLK